VTISSSGLHFGLGCGPISTITASTARFGCSEQAERRQSKRARRAIVTRQASHSLPTPATRRTQFPFGSSSLRATMFKLGGMAANFGRSLPLFSSPRPPSRGPAAFVRSSDDHAPIPLRNLSPPRGPRRRRRRRSGTPDQVRGDEKWYGCNGVGCCQSAFCMRK